MNALALAIALAIAAFVPNLQPGDTIPAIPLVDQSGRAFSFAQLRGNAVVLSFIYTRCADPRMCPLVSSKFARLQRAIGDAPVRLLEITLDPRFDTPRVLRDVRPGVRRRSEALDAGDRSTRLDRRTGGALRYRDAMDEARDAGPHRSGDRHRS